MKVTNWVDLMFPLATKLAKNCCRYVSYVTPRLLVVPHEPAGYCVGVYLLAILLETANMFPPIQVELPKL